MIVYIEEEYGWKIWEWETKFSSPSELIDWWTSQDPDWVMSEYWKRHTDDSVPSFADMCEGNITACGELPSASMILDERDDLAYRHIHELEDTLLTYKETTYPLGGEPKERIADSSENMWEEMEGFYDEEQDYN